MAPSREPIAWAPSAARWALVLSVPLILLVLVLPRVNGDEVARLLREVGPKGLLALLPYALVLILDSLGWRLLFADSHRPPLRTLLATRLAAESATQTLPTAGVAGEAVALWRLALSGLPWAEVVGTLAARRVLLILGHGAALGLAAAVMMAGRPTSTEALGHTLTLALTSVALVAAAGMAGAVVRGQPMARLQRWLRRRPLPPRLRSWVERKMERLPRADPHLARLFALPASSRAVPAACFLLVFLAESMETWLILALLGADIGFPAVLSFEALLSLLRAMAFFIPAGLGVQDVGYLGFLALLGVPHAASLGAAFVLMKRLKEVLWIAAGYLVIARTWRRHNEAEPGREAAHEPKHPVRLRIAEPDHPDAPDRGGIARS